MAARSHSRATVKTVHAASVARIHTYLAFSAFLSALVVGCLLHYTKIVKNGVAGYPEEWFPSVSATIGDWYPERNIFQVLIALTSGPRFALTYLQYHLHSTQSPKSSLPGFVFLTGVARTFACAGWVYVPSYEAHDFHDVAMVSYIICNIPWMFGGWACSTNPSGRNRRKWITSAFFGSIVPLVYFFIQHKVHRIPGAYTRYAFFEWGLIFLDVLYDSATELDFSAADLQFAIGPSLASKGIAAAGTDDIAPVITAQADGSGLAKIGGLISETAAINSDTFAKTSEPVANVLAPLFQKMFTPSERHFFLTFLSDVYLSFIFWTLLTSLAPSFFYYSVWQLGVAGHELTLLTTLSPALLALEDVSDWARSRNGRTALWGISFVGIAAYLTRFPLVRMLCVGTANASLMVGKAVDWSDPTQAGYEGILLGLGLVLSSLSKHANHSNNPVWSILNEKSGGWNKTGLVLAILALYEFNTRPRHSASSSTSEGDAHADGAANAAKSAHHIAQGPWLPSALALGSLLFTLHQLLSDSSTLITWSWTGYPIKGPVPNLHGAITLVMQALGLLIPLSLATAFAGTPGGKLPDRRQGPSALALLSHPAWFAWGTASAYTMYAREDWVGYAGGLGLAVFLMSIVPSVVHRAAVAAQGGRAHKVFFTAWVVVSVLDFVSTMTVAYAFVPGAQIFRERTDLVLSTQVAMLLPAFQAPRRSWPKLTLPTSTTAAYMRNFLALTSVLAVVATLYRLPTNSPRPYRAGPRIVRAGIWTVHFGIDDEGRDSQRRMRDLIKDMELDIVGLLETDLQRIPYGNRDLTRVISEDLGFHVDLGPGPNKHTWGAVLLSKYPILNSTHHLLPSPHGELAPAIEAVLDIYGTEVTVVVAHNGQEEDPLDRELQSTELARIMASHETRPVIFLGYVVTKPKATRPAPYQILVEDGRMHDIDETDWDRWCEYILYRGLYRTSYARISRSTITDTELQLGQFVVPKHGFNVTDDSENARYIRSHKESLPEDHWFPMEYYGNEQQGGKRGHFYHVFGTPLYYQLPEGAVV